MAIRLGDSNTMMFSLKISLMSIGVLSVAVVLSLYLPAISEFLVSQLPVFCTSFRSWLTPPYLYFVINCIIITIAASSKFQKKTEEQIEAAVVAEPTKVPTDMHEGFTIPPAAYMDESIVVTNPPLDVRPEFQDFNGYVMKDDFVEVRPEFEVAVEEDEVKEPLTVDVAEVEVEVPEEEESNVEEVVEKGIVDEEGNESNLMSNRMDSMEISPTDSMEIPMEYAFGKEKPPVSVRFGHHRKLTRGYPEAGKSLRKVSKPKRQAQDTLENTWKMITEGRSIPLARHLKKSDTWETHGRPHNVGPTQEEEEEAAHHPSMKKADTFNDHTNRSSPSLIRSSGSGKIKKDPSLGQEELNRRVEAFINKFNEDMRLQRLESLKQYNEMINRGAH